MLFLHRITENEVSFPKLSESILERVAKKADKVQSLSAYSTAYKLFSVFGIDDEIVLPENGKPVLKGESAFISLSHSKGFVLCGLSQFPIGVDVEKIRPINLNVAKRFCSERELEICNNEKMFFRLWTLKEAYFKLYGNISDVRKIEFSFEGDKVFCSDKKIKAKSFYKNDLAIAVCEKTIR